MFIPVPDGYYKSDHWKRKAAEARAYYGHQCQRCGARGWLDVHHLPDAYGHLWNEPLHLLRPLCHGRCHKKGRYTDAEIRDDRNTLRFIRTIDRLFSVSWRAVRWVARLPVRLARSKSS